MDRHMDGQTDGWTDRWMDILMDGQTDGGTGWFLYDPKKLCLQGGKIMDFLVSNQAGWIKKDSMRFFIQ